jgi:hypothetical protein
MNNISIDGDCTGYRGFAFQNFEARRTSMQKRFCSCGAPVLVEYKLNSARPWETRFWGQGAVERRSLAVCPCCGRRLDIHSLR